MSLERHSLAEAEAVDRAEGNMCGATMRGPVACRGLRDRRKVGGQAATAIGGCGSLVGRNFCPKPVPSVPL